MIIRIPVVSHWREPPPDTGTFKLEAEMKRIDAAAEDAQIAAEDFENAGRLDEAETALALRDTLNERYAELRRQVDGEW